MSASASEACRLPDFIIIGAMKSATSTLHEQLARQPGIVMSDPKEPNFFSDDEQWARGTSWYRGLFAGAKPGDLRGESSTHYTKLPTYPLTIDRMRRHLTHGAKLVYIMRHPIDRLISQYIHEWTQGVVSGTIDEALDSHPEMIEYSRYAMQLKPFIDAWGEASILPLFFERFTAHEQESLERVCRFIGYARQPKWSESLGEQNVSSERMRRSAWRDAIAKFPGMTALRRAFVPQSVRDRIKGAWMIKERPALSNASMARLKSLFDEDLATLGSWLGLDGLCCDNFKSMAANGHPTWRAQAKVTAA